MSWKEDCIFCKIVSGQLPSFKIYEDDYVSAFLDIQPAGRGHTLIVPKQHYENVHDIPEEMEAYIYQIAKRIADAQKNIFSPAGISIAQNNGRAAGQVIFHFHVHVIPKSMEFQEKRRATEEDLRGVAEELKRALGV
jgi:histidine triad (HIT) family protein